MTAPALGSLRRTRLAGELRRLREEAGLTLDEAEAATKRDIKRASINRMETCQQKARPPQVRTLLDAYGVTGEQAESLLQLSREVDQRGWWSEHANEITAQHMEYLSFEAKASAVFNYESQVLPGLLQTEGYAEAVVRGSQTTPLPESVVTSRVKARMERKHRLEGDNPLLVFAVVDETALRRRAGSRDVMVEQLDYLLARSDDSNIAFQVISSGSPPHPGMSGPFSILEFPGPWESDAMYVDCPAGELWVEGAALEHAKVVFRHLQVAALDRAGTRKLIDKARQEISR